MSTPVDPRTGSLETRIAARRAEGRLALAGSLAGIVIGAGLWWALDNLALGAAIGGTLAILLPAPLAALTRGRRRA